MTLRIWSAILAGLFCIAGAQAHQQKAAVSSVLFNARSNKVEVYHRFFIHDAEHAVKHLFGKKGDIIASKATQEQFANYAARQFELHNLQQQKLPLKLLGYEVEGKFFYVYQELPIPANLKGLVVKQAALLEIWSQQQNLVNVEGRGPVQSLQFSRGNDQQQILIPALAAPTKP